MVGEKPGLGADLLKSAGPAIGLVDGSPWPFDKGAGRGDLCLMGDRPGDCGAFCSVGLTTESALGLLSGAGRGEVCLVGENPGDGGACGGRLGPIVGLEEGTWLAAGAAGGDWCFTGGGSGGGKE